ncbi:MAG: amino acid permease [Phycisphaeraceae bacterium]|nr:MAG: amino acid permease [Phycisphaeraceae bacterium]
MLISEKRPRNLAWYHAGPLLFGDWGTSRLYVLGLAFYYTGHASVTYLLVMSVIMAAVAWAYTIVCRSFPDGGGVYSAARQLSPMLSVIGATLLICDFIVTAALSAVEAFHYLGAGANSVVGLSIGAIAALGVVNWYGAKNAGRLALLIALAALATSAAVALVCIPLIPEGLSAASATAPGVDSWWQRWESLVRIVLALSGVEAVANMTGLMKQPVARESKRTIWPVLFEVVLLNLVFCVALNALPGLRDTGVPDYVVHEVRGGLSSDQVPAEVKEYRDTALKALAEHGGTRMFGPTTGRVLEISSGVVFGLLLLSATNTAIMAMVSVFYALAKDGELPSRLTRLNYSGVPWIGLVVAVAAPAAVLAVEADPKALGELYAIGVVGAIAINLFSCAANRGLAVGVWERRGLWGLAGLMTAIELTIIVAKPNATVFAGGIIAAVLVVRYVARAGRVSPLPEPTEGWLEEIRSAKMPTTGGPRIMLAARGRDQAEFAVDLARRRGATLFGIFVRTLRLLDVGPGALPRIEDDRDAQEALGTIAHIAKKAGVGFVPIYVSSPEISSEILDYTVTFGCDTLIMGKSRRALFARKLAGDVLAEVSQGLPEGVTLITRAPGPFERGVAIGGHGGGAGGVS